MKNILFHVGNPKCGSTSLQDYFAGHRPFLGDIEFIDGLSGSSKDKRAQIDTLYHECSEETFISDERISGYRFQNQPPRLKRSDYIDIIKDKFDDYNVSILLFIRRQDRMIESSYLNAIHSGLDMSLDEYVEGSGMISYYDQVKNWNIFDELFVVPFNRYKDDNKKFIKTVLAETFDSGFSLPDQFRKKNVRLGGGSLLSDQQRDEVMMRHWEDQCDLVTEYSDKMLSNW